MPANKQSCKKGRRGDNGDIRFMGPRLLKNAGFDLNIFAKQLN